MLDDVVSVARPASSDGGSPPIDIRRNPALLVWPSLPVAAVVVPTATTAKMASPTHIIERFRILLLPPLRGLRFPFEAPKGLHIRPSTPRKPDRNEFPWATAARSVGP